MRHQLSLSTAAVISAIPSLAFAHGGQTIDHDRGAGLLWLYAIVFAVIVGVIVRRIYLRTNRPPGHQHLTHLAELGAALTSNLATLRNAEDYPSECGLTAKERQSRLNAIATIRRLIEEEELKLASAQEDARSVPT